MKMNEQERIIEGIIREGRLADENVLVDEKFSEELKTELLNNYLNLKQSNMEKIKSFIKTTPGKIVGVLSLVLVVFIGYLVSTAFVAEEDAPLLVVNDTENEVQEVAEVVKIAGMLAIADSDVTVKDDLEDGVWYAATQGETVREGFRIKTGDDSKAVIALDDGSAIRLNENTEVYLSSLESNRIVVDHVSGQTYHRVEKNELREYIVTNVEENEDFTVTALGTAFDVELEEKTVKCLESKVKVKYSKDKPEELVEEGEEFVLEDDEGEVKGIEGESLDNDWYDFNKEKDKEANADLGVFENEDEPTLDIISPKSGHETTASSVVVKGETEPENDVKLKIRDEWYMVEKSNGKFEKTVQLASGKNTIYVKAYSPAGIRTVETLIVYRVSDEEEPETPPASDTKSFRITSLSSPAPGKISVSWEMEGYTEKAFKVVFDKEHNPTYPGYNEYIGDGATRSKTFSKYPLTEGGTFYVRLCRYDGSKCDMYTSEKSVNVQKVEETNPEEIDISITSITVGDYNETKEKYPVTINWEIAEGTANAFKIVWSVDQNPTYPEDNPTYKDGSARSVTVYMPAGDFYVRVGRYVGGEAGCDSYSLQESVHVE